MTRELNANERAALHMLAFAEALADNRKPKTFVEANESQYADILKVGITPISVKPMATNDESQVFIVHMHTIDYFEYAKYAAKVAGVTVNIDGSITTQDGIVAANDYKIPGCVRIESSNG